MVCFAVFVILLLFSVSVRGEVQSSIPTVLLQFEALSTDTFSSGCFSFIENGDTLTSNVLIRHRGATAATYQKQSFALKFIDEAGYKANVSFMGMRSDNYWILDAMAVDKARMRNRVAMDLWLDFSSKPYYYDREPKLCNGYRGKFVEVYVNGSYNGLYCLMERVDRKQLKLKKAKDHTINGILYKSVSHKGSFFGSLSPYDNSLGTWMRFEFQYPDIKEYSLIDWKPLYDAMEFVNTASALEFEQGVWKRFDMYVFMDYYLFSYLLSARDNCGKNLFLSYYNINQYDKLLITPWDIDHSFGRAFDGSEEVPDFDFTWGGDLFRRFECDIPIYRLLLIHRYAFLRENAFSLSSLRQRFADYFHLFEQTGAAKRETERWSGADGITLDFEEEKAYIDLWIEQRLQFTDSLFHYHPVHSSIEGVNPMLLEQPQKTFENGMLRIRKNGNTYNVNGTKVE